MEEIGLIRSSLESFLSGHTLKRYDTDAGDAPILRDDIGEGNLLGRLQEIESIYSSVKENHVSAEKYAICLSMCGMHESSKKLFDELSSDGLGEFPHDDLGRYMMVSDVPGSLGLEGVFRYASSCYSLGHRIEAEELYLKIASIQTPCSPFRAGDIVLESLEMLVDIYGMPFENQLREARRNTY